MKVQFELPRAILQAHKLTSKDVNRENLSHLYITKKETVVTNGHHLTRIKHAIEPFAQSEKKSFVDWVAGTDHTNPISGAPSQVESRDDWNEATKDFWNGAGIMVPSNAIKPLLVGAKTYSRWFLELLTPRKAILSRTDADRVHSTIPVELSDLSFPDYNQVIPEYSKTAEDLGAVGMDLAYIADFWAYLKASKVCSGGSFTAYPSIRDDLSPIRIDLDSAGLASEGSGLSYDATITWVLMPIRI